MKRPISLYFVAGWCFFSMMLAARSISGLIVSIVADDQSRKAFQTQTTGMIGILVIWHLFRLIQLKSFNRWFTILFLSYVTVVLVWNAVILVPQANNQLRTAIPFITFGVINLMCIWYFMRRSFRDFSVKFVAESEAEKRLRDMQKKIYGDS